MTARSHTRSRGLIRRRLLARRFERLRQTGQPARMLNGLWLGPDGHPVAFEDLPPRGRRRALDQSSRSW